MHKRGVAGLLVIAAVALAVSVTLVSKTDGSNSKSKAASPILGGTVSLVDQPWTCNSEVDLDLVKVVTHVDKDAVFFGKNCTGTIRRIEIDTWAGDGIKVNNADPVAHDLNVESGYVVCHDKLPTLHQDGIQAMGGSGITFIGLTLDCGRADATLVDADLFINKSGSGASTPTDIVCDACLLGPGPAAHEANIGESVRSGLRNSMVCPDKTKFNGSIDIGPDAVDPVNENNTQLIVC